MLSIVREECRPLSFLLAVAGRQRGSVSDGGGAAYYHSPIQPEPLRPGCHGYGTYGNYVADENLRVKAFTSQYYASQMINLEWVRHRAGVHKLYRAGCDMKDGAGHSLITGEVQVVSFGGEQYMWKYEGPNSHPEPDDPPVRKTLPPGTATIALPKASVTVVRGRV